MDTSDPFQNSSTTFTCQVKFYLGSRNQKVVRSRSSFKWNFPTTVSSLRELSNLLKIKINHHRSENGAEFFASPPDGQLLSLGIAKSTSPLNRSPTDAYVTRAFRAALNQPQCWLKIAVFDCGSFFLGDDNASRSTPSPFHSPTKVDLSSLQTASVDKLKSIGYKGGKLSSIISIQKALSNNQNPNTTPPVHMSQSSSETQIRQVVQNLFTLCSEHIGNIDGADDEANELALSEFRISVIKGLKKFFSSISSTPNESSRVKRPREESSPASPTSSSSDAKSS